MVVCGNSQQGMTNPAGGTVRRVGAGAQFIADKEAAGCCETFTSKLTAVLHFKAQVRGDGVTGGAEGGQGEGEGEK